MTYRELLMKIELMLSESGVPNADYDSFQLFSDATGMTKGDYLMKTNFTVPAAHVDVVMQYALRRADREPLQHILGFTYFMGHRFLVDKNVLIPRYDTEVLVEHAIEALEDCFVEGEKPTVLDMCTGSGCILLGMFLGYMDKYKKSQLDVKGIGIDISDYALELAQKNAQELGLTDIATFKKSDLFNDVDGRFDLIISNPPYINTDVCEKLMPEVKDYEPRLALDGGVDGMDFYSRIIPAAPEYLNIGGRLLLEIGHDQGERVRTLMEDNGFFDVDVYKDLAGMDRVVIGHL